VPTPTPTPAHARVTVAAAVSGSSLPARLLAKAETQAGTPYVWAGDAPGGFDCSGLIYWAAAQLGISLPRDTFGMLAGSAHLEWVSTPEPGDLAFFGSGHVELWVRHGETFGAQQPGTSVGFHSYGYGYVPTTFLRIR
jgi:cell wall-associated NlpC family hydrolase